MLQRCGNRCCGILRKPGNTKNQPPLALTKVRLLAALGRGQTGSGLSARLFLAAIATKPSHFGSRDGDLKIAVARNLPFQIFVEFTFKLTNPSAANTCHVDVVPRAVAFVEV